MNLRVKGRRARPLKKVFTTALLFTLILSNVACPQGSGPGGSWSDVDFVSFLSYKGLIFCWLIDAPVPWPSSIRVTIPSNVDSSGFAGSWPGYFSIDTNFDGRIGSGDFWFPVRASNQMKGWIDFNFNGAIDSDETTIDYSLSSRELTLNTPGSGTLARGSYYFSLAGVNFDYKDPSPSTALGDWRLNLAADSQTITRNFIALNRASILPQIAYGELGDGRTMISKIVAGNPSGISLVGGVQFYKEDGMTWPVKIGNNTSASHVLTMPPISSSIWEIDPFGKSLSTERGWGMAWGYVSGSVNYTVLRNARAQAPLGDERFPLIQGDVETDAAVGASDVGMKHVINVLREDAAAIDTGIAIVNPASVTANMTMTLKDSTGQKGQQNLALASKQKTARFFWQFFNLANLPSFNGTVVIRSDTDISVTSLRTIKGNATANLPAGNLRVR